MKQLTPKLTLWITLLFGCLTATSLRAQGHQGHRQSGISGWVCAGFIVATPTGEGSRVVPDHVRVYSVNGELLTEVETEIQGNILWHFEVFLKPGNYIVLAYAGAAPEDGGALYSEPVPVTVQKKQFTDLVVSFRPL